MNRIKILRAENGVKQIKLAAFLNAAQNTVSAWENGKTEPDLETVKKIADYFKTTTDYILGLTDNPRLPADYISAEKEKPAANMLIGDIKTNNGVIGVNAPATITINNGEMITRELSKEEMEILKIYGRLDVKNRHKLLDFMFKLEEGNQE